MSISNFAYARIKDLTKYKVISSDKASDLRDDFG